MSDKVEYVIDNRGTPEVPYGFVYFKDTRVAFAKGEGVVEARGWQSTLRERKAVEKFLDEELPGWRSES